MVKTHDAVLGQTGNGTPAEAEMESQGIKILEGGRMQSELLREQWQHCGWGGISAGHPVRRLFLQSAG